MSLQFRFAVGLITTLVHNSLEQDSTISMIKRTHRLHMPRTLFSIRHLLNKLDHHRIKMQRQSLEVERVKCQVN